VGNKKFINELRGGGHVLASKESIERASSVKKHIEEIDKKIKELERDKADLLDRCNHEVLWDSPGCDFYVRECLACGKRELL